MVLPGDRAIRGSANTLSRCAAHGAVTYPGRFAQGFVRMVAR
ncbi:hypothetical protein BH24ACT14_BH24ACT14_00470 [soil metagenome]